MAKTINFGAVGATNVNARGSVQDETLGANTSTEFIVTLMNNGSSSVTASIIIDDVTGAGTTITLDPPGPARAEKYDITLAAGQEHEAFFHVKNGTSSGNAAYNLNVTINVDGDTQVFTFACP